LLAGSLNLHAKWKFLILTLLIAVGALVFLGVTELSRASASNLTAAIDTDLGQTGTYRIQPSTELALSGPQLLAAVRSAVADLVDEPLRAARRLPPVHPECPPYDQVGDVAVAVLLDQTGRPADWDPGAAPLAESDLCLGGMVAPREAVREATAFEKANFGAEFVLDPTYEHLVRLTSAVPAGYTVVAATGRESDETGTIRDAVTSALAEYVAAAAVPVEQSVVVTRGDTGQAVRSASNGITLVYALISWGVLLVSGLGILVAELIVLRDRTWYFGLARAVGARKTEIAWLVLADIALVLLAGLTLAALVALVAGPTIRAFGMEAFQTDLRLVRPSAMPRLLLGSAFMLMLGGVYPAWRATRLDPLDVLERR
jgi:hypothetical protein